MHIVMAFSPAPGAVDLVDLQLPEGACVADALQASGLAARHPGLDMASLRLGIWGALCECDAVLREGDRVELYRPLRVDPMQARRERSKAHRERVKARAPPLARAPKRP